MTGPPLELGSVREHRPRRRRLAAWPALFGGPLGALSPVAALTLYAVATEGAGEIRVRELLNAVCIGGSVAVLIGLPAAVTAVALAPRLPFYPTGGAARGWADFGTAFLAGSLTIAALVGLMILGSS